MSYYTENLSDFGYRELDMAADLLKAFCQERPDSFSDEGVKLAMNKASGNVFLVNGDYQVLMMNCGDLEMYFSCPECGCEGFKDELMSNGEECCTRYLLEINEIPECIECCTDNLDDMQPCCREHFIGEGVNPDFLPELNEEEEV